MRCLPQPCGCAWGTICDECLSQWAWRLCRTIHILQFVFQRASWRGLNTIDMYRVKTQDGHEGRENDDSSCEVQGNDDSSCEVQGNAIATTLQSCCNSANRLQSYHITIAKRPKSYVIAMEIRNFRHQNWNISWSRAASALIPSYSDSPDSTAG